MDSHKSILELTQAQLENQLAMCRGLIVDLPQMNANQRNTALLALLGAMRLAEFALLSNLSATLAAKGG